MPIDHSPVKTRSGSKVTGDKTAVQRTVSDSSLSLGSDNIQAGILTAVETALSNENVIGKLVDMVATKVSEAVNENLKSSLQQALAEIEALKAEVSALKNKIQKTEEGSARQADELEQYQRRNNLRVFGIAETEGEDTDTAVIDLFKTKLGVNIDVVDIDRSHRVGVVKKPNSDGIIRPRPIIVKFVSYRMRRMVFDNKKKLKGSPVVVREDLTMHRQKLLSKAIAEHGARNVWTSDGRIQWVTADNKRGYATWSI